MYINVEEKFVVYCHLTPASAMYKFLVLTSLLAATFEATGAASESDCLLPITGGGGGAGPPQQKYGYDILKQECVPFTISSFDSGNANKFDTKENCDATCAGVFFRGLLGTEESPTTVIEVRSDNYVSRSIHYREDSMLLYGPKTQGVKHSKDKYFEIILHKSFTGSTDQMYSLFRSENQQCAEEKFVVYKKIIPVYIKITKECTIASLQRLCDTLSQHRSWSIAHLVAHFGHCELFNASEVQAHLNEIDPATGATPLMVAVKSCNVRMVQSLISLRCSLDTIDLEGNTVFHYAAGSNKDIINALASKTATYLNVYNKQGYTPLHMSCLANAPDCVRALIMAGADVNLPAAQRAAANANAMRGIVSELLKDNEPKLYQQDMKHGGTPLHWSASREVIEALVDKNCDINALNFDGRTALHVMVLRGRLECAIALLSRGAEHSIADNEGNTPLHLAVKQTNISIVQALVVFGADFEALNNAGHTARHMVPCEMSDCNYDKILYVLHAVGAQRCLLEVSGCGPGCGARADYCGARAPAAPRPAHAARDVIARLLAAAAEERAANTPPANKQGRLLCLDGGGIRGLVLVQILINLEAAIGRPIVQCFDWIAGTSTGGILALALASGKNLRECQRLYFRMKEYAFVGMRPYPSEPLETILKDNLGTETVMADLTHPKLMILALLADRKPVDLHIFRNYESAQEMLETHFNMTPTRTSPECDGLGLPPPAAQLVWRAARATGAAPSYFAASGRYLDGGLIGNNPTLDALSELAEMRLALRATGRLEEAQKTELKVIVSCGTGINPLCKIRDIDVSKPESVWGMAKLACGLSTLGNLLVDQASQSDGRVVDRARAWSSTLGVPYHRFSPHLSADVALDETSDELLVRMLWETHSYMSERRDTVAELKATLAEACS